MILSDDGWLQMFSGEWFWTAVDGFGCLQMVLGGFRWFSEIFSFSSYGEIRCFKFKRSRQLWEVFVVSSNNDAKVPLKQMTKFLGNSKYKVSLKKDLGGWEKFLNSPGFDPFLPILGQFFHGSPHLAYYWLAGLYSRLSIWQIFLFIETMLLLYFQSFNNLWTFLKSHYLFSWNLRKKWNFDLSKSHVYTFL